VQGRGVAAGSYARLSVLFVDPDALPPEFRDTRWRVLDADAVYQTLAPLYLPRQDPKTPDKKRNG
jgi:hypothetical protein